MSLPTRREILAGAADAPEYLSAAQVAEALRARRFSSLELTRALIARIERGDSALPIGVQIIGPYLEDRTVLAFAMLLERAFGGFVAPPGYA